MKVQSQNYSSNTFAGRIPTDTKRAIKTLTNEYLRTQNGYASLKGTVFNGMAIVTRGTAGTLLTGWLIHELPKVIHEDTISIITQVATGLGGLAVALSRLENDKIATGSASIKAKSFIKKLLENGYKSEDELVFGVKQYMNRTGGFFTSLIPNKFSSQRAKNIVNNSSLV